MTYRLELENPSTRDTIEVTPEIMANAMKELFTKLEGIFQGRSLRFNFYIVTECTFGSFQRTPH